MQATDRGRVDEWCCRPGGEDRLPRQETVLQTTGGVDPGSPTKTVRVATKRSVCQEPGVRERRPRQLPRHWTVLRPIGWCGEVARFPRRERGGDWEVLTVECQAPRPQGEDSPTSSHSPRGGYTTERSWVEPETGVRRDVEVVSWLASESQDQRKGTAASEGRHAWSMHTTSVAGLAKGRTRGTKIIQGRDAIARPIETD